MRQKTQLGKRLASAVMAVILAGSTMAGGAFPAYGEMDPDQTFGKEPITAVLGQGAMIHGLSFPSSVLLADEQANACAAQLFAYLKAVGESPYVLYGHQNDTHHKGGEDYPGSTSSDTKDITGSIAAIVGIDALSFTGAELPLPAGKKNSVEEAAQISIQAAQEGAILTLSAHMPNFSLVEGKGQDSDGDYDYSGYTPGNTKGDVMSRILPGGDLNEAYNGYLDLIADYGLILQAQQVPVLFRPLHENNGSWFWWGAAFCDEEGYKNVYRYTVEYLRDVRNVHNFLYVYSPGGPFEDLADFESRYPGDAYVDVIGFDMYHDNPSATDAWMQSFAETVLLIDQAAQIHSKIPVVAETGMRVGTSLNDGKEYGGIAPEGNTRPLWFAEIQQVLSQTNIPYYMVWANWDGANNFYSPYKTTAGTGHEMANAFINYYNDPTTVFANGTNFYGQVPVPAVERHGGSGYILAPASGDRILYPVTVKASLENVSGDVSFVLKNKEGDVSRVLAAKASTRDNALGTVYEAQITQEDLKELGKTTGTMDLVAGGSVLNTINVIFNIKEPELDPLVVDDFENYLGDSLLLLRDWATNSGSGCNVELGLSGDNKAEEDYGMAFRYTISENGNGEGWAGATKPYESNISSCNAMQLWVKPDGKGQKLVIQLTSNGEDFEVHLPEFAATTEGKYVTIPFAAMKGKNNGVFDPTNVSSFGIWCNTINPAGSGAWQVDSVIYVDDIHMINTDSSTVEFLDERINSDGSAGNGVRVIRNTMEAPLLWYGPGYEGMKSFDPESITVTTLYQGGIGGKYETSDTEWLLNGKDTDYVTFVYNCSDPEKAGWSVMGWGATVNGVWTDGPRYNAPNPNTLQDTTIMVSIKELKSVLGIERGASVSYLNLGTWNDGNLKSVTLTQNAVMPGRVIVENVPANYTYETNDVGWIMDAPDDKYINLVITCDTPAYSEWEIMGWGASVGEDWVEGPKYTSWKPATFQYAVSYSVKEFKELFGVTPERPMTYIKLGTYNDGRIVRLSLDDTRIPSVPFYSWRDRHPNAKKRAGGNGSGNEPSYESPNAAAFRALARTADDALAGVTDDEENAVFAMDGNEDYVIPANWGQLYLDDLGEEIAGALTPGAIVAVKYSASGDSKPVLLPGMDPEQKYTTVSAVWTGTVNGENYALFTLDSFKKAFKRSLIPADVIAINLAGDEDEITVEGIVVMPGDDYDLVDESNRLTEKYGQFPIKIADYNSAYAGGDEITVSITLDRAIRGNISANVGGVWNAGSELSGTVLTRTFTPDAADDGGETIYISPSDFNGSTYAEIVDVKIEVEGKINYDDAVVVDTDQASIVFDASSQEIAEAAGLTEDEIKAGARVEVVAEPKAISQENQDLIKSAAEAIGKSVEIYSASDVKMYKVPAKGSKTQVNYVKAPIMIRLTVPENADPNQTFAVARIDNASLLRTFSARAMKTVEWLSDFDDRTKTIAVETDQLGEFVIVAGEGLEAEGLYTFEEAWGGSDEENRDEYKVSISELCPEFELGDTVKVTAVFNKESNVKFMIGSETKEIQGRRITFETASYVDEIIIQAGDADKLPLKLLDVEIEFVEEAVKGDEIHTFANAWVGFETELDTYIDSEFTNGAETTVRLTFDKPVKVQLGYHKDGDWTLISSENFSTTMEAVIVPSDSYLNIQITDMNGNSVVKLMSIDVEQEEDNPVEAIYEFTDTWGSNDSTYEEKISIYCPEYKVGDKVRITATFDEAKQAKMMVNSDEEEGKTQKEIMGETGTLTLEATPNEDKLFVQAGALPLRLMELKVEILETVEAEAIYEFTDTWGSNGSTYEEAISKYCEEYKVGDRVRITATFDEAKQAKMMVNSDEEEGKTQKEIMGETGTLTLEATPKDDKLFIQAGDLPLRLMELKVEILETVGTEAIYEFTDTWGNNDSTYEEAISKYCEEYKVGDRVRITATFDEAKQAKMMVNSDEEEGKTQKEIMGETGTLILEATPKDDKLFVQAGASPLRLIDLKVEILQSESNNEAAEAKLEKSEKEELPEEKDVEVEKEDKKEEEVKSEKEEEVEVSEEEVSEEEASEEKEEEEEAATEKLAAKPEEVSLKNTKEDTDAE